MSHVDKLLLVSFALVLIVLGADSLSVSNRILAGFGSDCDELKRVRRSTCIEGDCKNGGFCWPTADIFCACPDAYTGKYCTIRINYCATTGPANCQNGATCSNTDTSPWFSCSCAPGFTGSRCETNIDDCASRPCANGRCTDLVNSYSCSCYSGWEGANCNINTNDCPAGACLNGGRCLDGNGTYTCDCSGTGLSGARCETNIDDCASKPCLNGLCTDLVKNYSCSCFTGWEGRNCSVDTDYCLSGPCRNGGVCSDGNSTFYCNCSGTDFQGANCSSRIDNCAPNPCQNGGRCIDGVRSYTCDCADTGFAGATCETNIDDCASIPCQNGLCADLVKNYSCSCFSGWMGRNCSVISYSCLPGFCQNGGVCDDKNSTCVCLPGYSGANCSLDQPDCTPNPCDAPDEVCLEKSDSSNYNNKILPAPFDGPFKFELAAGYLCLKSYASLAKEGSLRFHVFAVLSVAALLVAFTTAIAILVLRCRGSFAFGESSLTNGWLSGASKTKDCTNDKTIELEAPYTIADVGLILQNEDSPDADNRESIYDATNDEHA